MQKILLLLLSTTLISCARFQHIPGGKYELPSGATVTVINERANNLVQGLVEQAILSRGISVISDGEVIQSVVAEEVLITDRDTLINRSILQPVRKIVYANGESDYVLRYRFEGGDRGLAFFNASLVDPTDGQIVATFTFTSGFGYRRTHRVLRKFAETMF